MIYRFSSLCLFAALAMAAPVMAQQAEYIDTGVLVLDAPVSEAAPVAGDGAYIDIGAYPGTVLEAVPSVAAPPVVETVPLGVAAPVITTPPLPSFGRNIGAIGAPDEAYTRDRLAAFDRNGDGRITTQEALIDLDPL